MLDKNCAQGAVIGFSGGTRPMNMAVQITEAENGFFVNLNGTNKGFRQQGAGEEYNSRIHDTYMSKNFIATSLEEARDIIVEYLEALING